MTEKTTVKTPVICDRNGDLSRKWYVEFAFLNPYTGEYTRFRKMDGVNCLSTADERRKQLLVLLDYWNEQIFEKNYNPFEDGRTVHIPLKSYPIELAFKELLKDKKARTTHTTYRDSKSRVKSFTTWLKEKGLNRMTASEIRRAHISDYLRHVSSRTKGNSNRNRNNHLTELKADFNTLKEMEFIDDSIANPCDLIKKVNSKSERHLIYSNKEMARMMKWLEKNDPYLLFYIRHIIMGFRTIEITRLRVNQYDLEEGTIRLWAGSEKTGNYKVKKIFQQYLPIFEEMNLDEVPGSHFMFTSKQIPGNTPTTRDFFTKRFKKMKDELGFGHLHTMYGIRHTTIVDLVRTGMPVLEVMKYSGHKSLSAFQSYIQKYLDDGEMVDVGNKISFRM